MAEGTIGVSDKLKNYLSSKGVHGESYEEIIWRLIKKWKIKNECPTANN